MARPAKKTPAKSKMRDQLQEPHLNNQAGGHLLAHFLLRALLLDRSIKESAKILQAVKRALFDGLNGWLCRATTVRSLESMLTGHFGCLKP